MTMMERARGYHRRHDMRVYRGRRGFTLIELMVALLIIALLLALFLPHYWQARARSNYVACEQNLRNIAVALQAYANDNGQLYPSGLQALTPDYLVTLPTCPSAGANTYLAGYQESTAPVDYTVSCSGSHHTLVPGVGVNEPRYEMAEGLVP